MAPLGMHLTLFSKMKKNEWNPTWVIHCATPRASSTRLSVICKTAGGGREGARLSFAPSSHTSCPNRNVSALLRFMSRSIYSPKVFSQTSQFHSFYQVKYLKYLRYCCTTYQIGIWTRNTIIKMSKSWNPRNCKSFFRFFCLFHWKTRPITRFKCHAFLCTWKTHFFPCKWSSSFQSVEIISDVIRCACSIRLWNKTEFILFYFVIAL